MPVMVMSCARVRRTSTGRRNLLAAKAATAAQVLACVSLPPKAPPMRKHCTVTKCLATPSTRATTSCVSAGCCVEECTKMPPASSGIASAAWVSK